MVDFDNKNETIPLLTKQNWRVHRTVHTHWEAHRLPLSVLPPLGSWRTAARVTLRGQGAGTGLTVLRFPDTSPLPTLFPLFSLNGFVRYLQCSCSHEMRLKEKKKGSQPLGTQGAAGPSGCWGWAGAPGGLGGLPPEDITVPSLCLLRQSATHCLEARRWDQYAPLHSLRDSWVARW